MTLIAVVSPEPVRRRMAGMGIRAARLARTLREAGHEAVLAGAEVEAGFDPGAPCVRIGEPEFARVAGAAAVAVVSGHAGKELLAAGFAGALVADLYDPFLVENLAYREALGPRVFRNDRRALFGLIDRADLVLAASEEQRLFYLGLLLGRGRLTAELLDGDPEGHGLVAVAPFGVDEEPPGPPAPHPALGAAPHDVLFGGVYDWYDPGLVLDAWPRVLAEVPDARLVFSDSPNPETTPQHRLREAIGRAGREGWGRSVRSVPWLPHDERGGFYRACRAAVLAHRPSLETSLSFRTRVLDFLWASLPVVSTEGGSAARLLVESGAGLVVPAEPGALARGLVSLLLDDTLHLELASRAARAAAGLGWSRTLEPLLKFAARPRRRPQGREAWGRAVLARLGRAGGR